MSRNGTRLCLTGSIDGIAGAYRSAQKVDLSQSRAIGVVRNVGKHQISIKKNNLLQ